ncbi:hypothetical protein UFOVP967_91 [uncultured Caudovirales phage]|uniref:Uncharacterized protein n=1 Tax=uncultured Caudovirales phage TaxID=2100421 RepID=A0A6J5Q8V8_9CAUD|nr:hypothetical protein UFOVP521_25 [uncultured Caudovirales phage]CAB4168046.1 hypothetical protein UFOVP856_98 [uncultured Caudovirales phage]CAB4174872.1 hypothetical protein UFOVP967_91 [uncultured Caudovirales phage]CAB4180719.1 hypothetical protein UFOVP1036_91 [uncultured Caudovirales phage]CAB4186308.1 hypothetical protein UFOVP1132_77 [uncultured Caudovirales phage]
MLAFRFPYFYTNQKPERNLAKGSGMSENLFDEFVSSGITRAAVEKAVSTLSQEIKAVVSPTVANELKETREKASRKKYERRNAPKFDESGNRLTSSGTLDRRFIKVTEEGGRAAPVRTKPQRMAAIFGARDVENPVQWEIINEGVNPEGVKSVTGTLLHKYVVLRPVAGQSFPMTEIICGRGEAVKYAGVGEKPKRAYSTSSKSTSKWEHKFNPNV